MTQSRVWAAMEFYCYLWRVVLLKRWLMVHGRTGLLVTHSRVSSVLVSALFFSGYWAVPAVFSYAISQRTSSCMKTLLLTTDKSWCEFSVIVWKMLPVVPRNRVWYWLEFHKLSICFIAVNIMVAVIMTGNALKMDSAVDDCRLPSWQFDYVTGKAVLITHFC